MTSPAAPAAAAAVVLLMRVSDPPSLRQMKMRDWVTVGGTALTVEGTRQQTIVNQLELLVAGGLDREAADPKGVEKVGDETDGRPPGQKGVDSSSPRRRLCHQASISMKIKTRAQPMNNRRRKVTSIGGTSSNGRRFSGSPQKNPGLDHAFIGCKRSAPVSF